MEFGFILLFTQFNSNLQISFITTDTLTPTIFERLKTYFIFLYGSEISNHISFND